VTTKVDDGKCNNICQGHRHVIFHLKKKKTNCMSLNFQLMKLGLSIKRKIYSEPNVYQPELIDIFI
jgi:hypothetical protein